MTVFSIAKFVLRRRVPSSAKTVAGSQICGLPYLQTLCLYDAVHPFTEARKRATQMLGGAQFPDSKSYFESGDPGLRLPLGHAYASKSASADVFVGRLPSRSLGFRVLNQARCSPPT